MSQVGVSQRNLIFGFGSGRRLGGLNLPVGRLDCTDVSDCQGAKGVIP
jgi:hypothetical protein